MIGLVGHSRDGSDSGHHGPSLDGRDSSHHGWDRDRCRRESAMQSRHGRSVGRHDFQPCAYACTLPVYRASPLSSIVQFKSSLDAFRFLSNIHYTHFSPVLPLPFRPPGQADNDLSSYCWHHGVIEQNDGRLKLHRRPGIF